MIAALLLVLIRRRRRRQDRTPRMAMAIAKKSSFVSAILHEQEGEFQMCRGRHFEEETVGHSQEQLGSDHSCGDAHGVLLFWRQTHPHIAPALRASPEHPSALQRHSHSSAS